MGKMVSRYTHSYNNLPDNNYSLEQGGAYKNRDIQKNTEDIQEVKGL